MNWLIIPAISASCLALGLGIDLVGYLKVNDSREPFFSTIGLVLDTIGVWLIVMFALASLWMEALFG